ncbi:AAA domain-containing protein [Pimelobacter simplex]|uniref:AAA domain-containing protein n=1 Tax=Nocardioides simplex TaxID=2045 RepID=A0A7J5E495_NOCSI|nr:AAA family ATPase [Pimelobacter simplex]KAB2813100.1 AAA domain-containing protein [Pimelobacter simplex]
MSDEQQGGPHRWGRPGASQVERAAAEIRQALIDEQSALAPGRKIWALDTAREVYDVFNGQPDEGHDSYDQKLARQFAGASEEAVILFTELNCLMLLPLTNYRAETKRARVRSTLGLAGINLDLPAVIDEALDRGVLNGGQAFTSGRYRQLWFLVEMAAVLLALPTEQRRQLFDDPVAFRDTLQDEISVTAPSQLAAVLYLWFPDYYLPIVSVAHKQRIVTAYADRLLAPSGDLDRDLHDIHARLVEESGGAVDLYKSPFVEAWETARGKVDPSSVRAWLIRGNGVNGKDLVPRWLADGWVSLAATNLREVEPGLTRDELKPIVDEDYAHASYAVKGEKLDEFHAFLTRMRPEHVVVTVDQGRLFVGRLSGEALYRSSPDGDSNLVRDVEWVSDEGIDYSDLPGELAARLKVQRDVLDLTQQLATLETLIASETTPAPRPVSESVVLPPATPELAEELHVSQSWLQECIDLLSDRPQLIFYGPPGTGKTYLAQALAMHVAGDRVRLVQFHPSYSYEDFFEGYRPKEEGGFKLMPGPMRKIVDQAVENPRDAYVLIIDEINRGNLAKVFGELYFLLEYRDQNVELLYADEDFSLPKNVFVIGTMNTADRSIALVDAAMRRRFAFLPLHPSEEPTRDVLRSWLSRQGYPSRVADLLDELNRRIEDPDLKIGPSYFMRPAVHADGGLERAWRTAILPLLEEHHYGEYDAQQVASRYGLAAVAASVDKVAKASREPADAPADTD